MTICLAPTNKAVSVESSVLTLFNPASYVALRSVKAVTELSQTPDRYVATLGFHHPDSQIGVAAVQIDRLNICHNFKGEVGILIGQLWQSRDYQMVGKRLGRGQTHPTGNFSLSSRPFRKGFGRLFKCLRTLQQRGTIVGQTIAILVTAKERQAKRSFQPLDLARYGGEAVPEAGRCAAQ